MTDPRPREPAPARGGSLHAKLSLLLLALLAALGVLGVLTILRMTRLYQMEVAQNLNRDLARQIAASEQERILAADGSFHRESLKELFHWLMVVNPSVEFYVLDARGAILGYDAPPGVVKREQVALEPIRSFLDRTQPLPILGDDPRDPARSKVFSVTPLPLDTGGDKLQGYLYVILAGEQVDSVLQMLDASYVVRLGLATATAYVAITAIVGFLAFRRLTRPLRQLQVRMRSFQEEGMVALPAARRDDDEVRLLERAFDEMASRIQAQMGEIRRTEELRRELVANISHDLRTPLAALQGYLDTLTLKSATLPDADRERYLRTALRHSEQLGRLVDELFQLSKLEANVEKPALEPFSLAELVQDSVQAHADRAEQAGVTLAAHVDPQASVVNADIGMIERVLDNLVDNAIGASRAGGRIDVRLARARGELGFDVQDDGPGITAADLPHVFDRFFRGRSPEKPREGSGLGLAISKRIVELHGGRIDVESVEGKGSVFRVRLPVVG